MLLTFDVKDKNTLCFNDNTIMRVSEVANNIDARGYLKTKGDNTFPLFTSEDLQHTNITSLEDSEDEELVFIFNK